VPQDRFADLLDANTPALELTSTNRFADLEEPKETALPKEEQPTFSETPSETRKRAKEELSLSTEQMIGMESARQLLSDKLINENVMMRESMPEGYKTFFGKMQIAAVSKGALEATARLFQTMNDIGTGLDDIANSIGIKKEHKFTFFKECADVINSNVPYWENILRNEGADGVDRLIGTVGGGLPVGILEWKAGVPFAAAAGAAEAHKVGESALGGAVYEGAKRAILGKLLDYYSGIKNLAIRRTLGATTLGATAALDKQSGEDMAIQTIMGFMLTGYRPLTAEFGRPAKVAAEPAELAAEVPKLRQTPEEIATEMRIKMHELAVEREAQEPEFGAERPVPELVGEGKLPGGRMSGAISTEPAAKLAQSTVGEALRTAKALAGDIASIRKNLPALARQYLGKAANTIEKNYGDAGAEIGKDLRDITTDSAISASKHINAVLDAVEGLTPAEKRIIVATGRYPERINTHIRDNPNLSIEQKIKLTKVHNELRDTMDDLMTQAGDVGFKRGELELKGSGAYYPNILNKAGKDFFQSAEEEGLGNPFVRAKAEKMVEEGKANSVEEALTSMLDWNKYSLRGPVPYFEKFRTFEPDIEWLEDPEKALPPLINKLTLQIEAARRWNFEPTQWGVEEAKRPVEFIRLRTLLAQIRDQYGSRDTNMLTNFIRTQFGLAGDVPDALSKTLSAVNRMETTLKIGYNIPVAALHYMQGDTNTFSAPISAHLKARAVMNPLIRLFFPEARKIYQQALRAPGVMDIRQDIPSTLESTGRGLQWLKKGLKRSRIRAAIISRYGFEQDINELIRLEEGGNLRRIVSSIKNLSVNPEKYLQDKIQKRAFPNPMTDENYRELIDRLRTGGTITPDEYDHIIYTTLTNTQFLRTIASLPIPVQTSPWARTGMLFKNYALNMTRLVWDEGVTNAAKGTFAPIVKSLLYFALTGEVYQLTKDLIYGGDKSLTMTMLDKPEKRNTLDVLKKLGWDMVMGGPGKMVDMAIGFGSYAVIPAVSSITNVLGTVPKLDHPLTAIRDFVVKESPILRTGYGLYKRTEELWTGDTRYYDYQRTRDRGFEWKYNKEHPGVLMKAKDYLKEKVRYEADLQYKYAAQSLVVRDTDAASKYLAQKLRDAPDRQNAIESIRRSMELHSPLGHVAQRDRGDFLDQFTPAEQTVIEKLQDEWTDDSADAIDKAIERTEE
jgi:hypothetical protein